MSLETANKKEATAWTKSAFAPLLEVLAFSIHPGSSESTTTLCLFGGTMYLTSQNNLKFDGIDGDTLKAKLAALKALVLDKTKTKAVRFESWWNNHCSLSGKVGAKLTETGQARAAETIAKADEKILGAKKVAADAMNEYCFDPDAATVAASIQDLSDRITKTYVVLNEHIFRGSTVTTGVHGETRILRYMFILFAIVNFVKREGGAAGVGVLKGSRGKPMGALRAKIIVVMEEAFVAWARKRNLVFGSSQGTCQGCSRALDIVKAGRGASGNPFKQWLDPLDLSGAQGTTMIAANIREHALNLVLCDFDTSTD